MISLRKLTVAAMVVAAATVLAVQAKAGTTNIPSFDPNQHVYVDSAWNGSTIPGNLESSLRATAAKQNLEAFIVFVQQGDESVQGSWGFAKGEDVVRAFAQDPRFPKAKFELITCVHSKNPQNPYFYNCGADVGSGPIRFGVNNADLVAAINSNFTAYVKQGNPPGSAPDWTGFATAVSGSINNAIVAHAQPTRPTVTPTRPIQPPVMVQPSGPSVFSLTFLFLPVWAWLLIVIGGGGTLLVFFFLSKSAREEFEAATRKTKPVTDTLNAQVQAFRMADGGMADGKMVYEEGSRSAAKYAEGMAAATAYFKHSDPVVKQVEALKRTIPTGIMAPFAFWAWNSATHMVRGQELIAESHKLTDDEVTSTSGSVATTKMTFDRLVQMLGAEYDQAKGCFREITADFDEASTKKDTVERILAQIAQKRDEVIALGIAWDLFAADHDDVEAMLATVKSKLKITGGDPIGAKALVDTLLGRAQTLLSSIDRAEEMQKHLGEVSTEIEQAHKKTTDQRASAVAFRLVKKTVAENWRLDEEHGNPDAFLAEADKQFIILKSDLIAGKVGAAETAKAAALASARAASEIVDKVLAAKTKADSELPALLKHFGEGSGINAALSFYGTQRFLEAATIVAVFAGIQATQTREAEVKAQAAAAHTARSTGVATSVRLTSEDTDESLSNSSDHLAQLLETVKQPEVNWAEVATTAATVKGYFDRVAELIAADVAAFGEASQAVADLHTAYNNALPVVNNPVAAQQNRNDLSQVGTVLGQLDQIMATDKSPWGQVRDSARGNIESVHQIQANAQADIDRDAQFKRELDEAYNDMILYGTPGRYGMAFANGFGYGMNVTAVTANALILYNAAQRCYAAQDYVAMQANLDNFERELWLADANARFAVLQGLYLSGDPYGVAYARQMGYVQGMEYDAWQEARYGSNIDYTQPLELPPAEDWRPNLSTSSPTAGGDDLSGGVQGGPTARDGGDQLGGEQGGVQEQWRPTVPAQQEQEEERGGDSFSAPASDPEPSAPASDGGDQL